jgi:HK97 family phage prohead protease
LGWFTEIIRPSAVDRSLSEKHDIRALWSHDTSLPLGRTGPKTLKVEKDRTGLYGEIATPSWAEQHLETVERGDVSAASFGFSVIEDLWRFKKEDDDERVIREVLDMIIYEVSPVAFPAYPQTKIRVERLAAKRERETLTRLRWAR